MNKSIAGYHMLMILSAVDGRFNGQEDEVINQFLVEQNLNLPSLDTEVEKLSTLPAEDYPIHFNNAMNAFYMDSSADERNHFLDLAVRLVIADHKITPRENLFLDELFNAWEANYTY